MKSSLHHLIGDSSCLHPGRNAAPVSPFSSRSSWPSPASSSSWRHRPRRRSGTAFVDQRGLRRTAATRQPRTTQDFVELCRPIGGHERARRRACRSSTARRRTLEHARRVVQPTDRAPIRGRVAIYLVRPAMRLGSGTGAIPTPTRSPPRPDRPDRWRSSRMPRHILVDQRRRRGPSITVHSGSNSVHHRTSVGYVTDATTARDGTGLRWRLAPRQRSRRGRRRRRHGQQRRRLRPRGTDDIPSRRRRPARRCRWPTPARRQQRGHRRSAPSSSPRPAARRPTPTARPTCRPA